jgi:cobalt-zinc-cadmium efflux system membrane fusion protein
MFLSSRLLSGLLCAAIGVSSLSGCGSKKEELPVNTKDLSSGYRTDTVHLRSPEQDLRFTGKVSYDQSRVDRIFPVVSGNVLEVNVALGTAVKQGQQLARVQSADVSGYLNTYNAAKADLAVAERNATNTEQLYKSSFASQSDLVAARAQLDKARSAFRGAEQVLKVYGANGGGDASGKPLYTVKAPVSGFVVERNINPGMQLRADNTTPLFTISNLTRVWVLINVYESDAAAVKVGLPVVITALAYPDRTFQGKITNISSVVDADTRVLQARVELNNPDGLLKPDMFCTITLSQAQTGQPQTGQALAVNPTAVIFSNDQYYVIRRKPGTPEPRPEQNAGVAYEVVPVKVLRSSARYRFVTGDLHDGDKVVTQGSLLLYNDLKGN